MSIILVKYTICCLYLLWIWSDLKSGAVPSLNIRLIMPIKEIIAECDASHSAWD